MAAYLCLTCSKKCRVRRRKTKTWTVSLVLCFVVASPWSCRFCSAEPLRTKIMLNTFTSVDVSAGIDLRNRTVHRAFASSLVTKRKEFSIPLRGKVTSSAVTRKMTWVCHFLRGCQHKTPHRTWTLLVFCNEENQICCVKVFSWSVRFCTVRTRMPWRPSARGQKAKFSFPTPSVWCKQNAFFVLCTCSVWHPVSCAFSPQGILEDNNRRRSPCLRQTVDIQCTIVLSQCKNHTTTKISLSQQRNAVCVLLEIIFLQHFLWHFFVWRSRLSFLIPFPQQFMIDVPHCCPTLFHV